VIEEELGTLDWQELPEGQDCRIIQTHEGDSRNKHEWADLHAWLKDRSESFYHTFSPRIKGLDLENNSDV
jgi:hypothetical protein